jgi:hypothetical protein
MQVEKDRVLALILIELNPLLDTYNMHVHPKLSDYLPPGGFRSTDIRDRFERPLPLASASGPRSTGDAGDGSDLETSTSKKSESWGRAK